MKDKSKAWTPEKRARQAEITRQNKPWEKSTGPKTDAGKQTVKNNAYKHGFRSEDYRQICKLLDIQKQFVKDVVKTRHESDRV